MRKFDKEKIAMFLLTKSESARLDAMLNLIESLIISEDVSFQEEDDDPEFGYPEDLIWSHCGESIFGKDE